MQAGEMLLLDRGDEAGRLECADDDMGIERLEEATDYDKSVDFRSGRSGFDCIWHLSGDEYGVLCLTAH
mgnify:FL=1